MRDNSRERPDVAGIRPYATSPKSPISKKSIQPAAVHPMIIARPAFRISVTEVFMARPFGSLLCGVFRARFPYDWWCPKPATINPLIQSALAV